MLGVLKQFVLFQVSQLMTDPVMDSYVQVHVTKPWRKAQEAATQNTVFRANTENPEWNEELSFLIDSRQGLGQLEMTIWDSNYVMDQALTDPIVIELNDIQKMGKGFHRQTFPVYVSAFSILLLISIIILFYDYRVVESWTFLCR